jgi:hypothetical protein
LAAAHPSRVQPPNALCNLVLCLLPQPSQPEPAHCGACLHPHVGADTKLSRLLEQQPTFLDGAGYNSGPPAHLLKPRLTWFENSVGRAAPSCRSSEEAVGLARKPHSAAQHLGWARRLARGLVCQCLCPHLTTHSRSRGVGIRPLWHQPEGCRGEMWSPAVLSPVAMPLSEPALAAGGMVHSTPSMLGLFARC